METGQPVVDLPLAENRRREARNGSHQVVICPTLIYHFNRGVMDHYLMLYKQNF